MPVPSPRNKILPARGNYSDLLANVASIVDGEICYAIDQDQYYQNESGTLVAVGATKAQGALADTSLQPTSSIDALADVDTTTVAPTDGQALVWDNANSKWEPGTVASGSVASIDDIGDVDTTTVAPTDGQALVWDNAAQQWEPGTVLSVVSSIDEIGDVDTTTAAPVDGQALIWNNSNSQWEPGGVSGEIEWTLTANATTDYIFAGPGFAGTETDPVVYVVRGQTYKFTNTMGAHPFQIQSTSGIGGTAYNDGITNNAVSNGTLTWEVRMDAPSTLYYQCTSHASMNGTIYVLDEGSAVQSIDDLSDVDTTTVAPTDGQVLAWDNAAGKWEPATIAGGGASVTTSDTAPASPSDGDLWYRSTDGRTYVYYDDGNTSQWVDANPNLPVGSDTFERSGTTVSLTNAGDSLDIGPLFVDGGAPADSVNVDSSGRLGIGTAAPSFLLHLDGGNMHRTRSAEGTSGTPQEDALVTYGNASTGYGGVYALNSYATDTSTQLAFKITDGSSNTSEALRIDSSGNVGVNVSSPTEKIDVEGNIRARDASNVRGAYLSNDGAVEIFKDTSNGYIDFKTSIAEDYDCRIQQESNGLRFDTGGNAATAERVRINANGTTTFNGTVETNERTITAGAFDLATGNHWTCGAITVPAPTNATAGTSGLIRITAGPVTWNTVFKFPGGTAPTIASFPAVIPFYVQDSSNILMGNVAEGSA